MTIAAPALGGSGDDEVFGGPGFDQFGQIVLLVLRVAPPAAVLWRHRARR
ncbi:MAG TPA: hypothetical protein VEF72_24770 [Mycobacterium sp.]|nr:hypothetical protein [Mycobacterium sp.]